MRPGSTLLMALTKSALLLLKVRPRNRNVTVEGTSSSQWHIIQHIILLHIIIHFKTSPDRVDLAARTIAHFHGAPRMHSFPCLTSQAGRARCYSWFCRIFEDGKARTFCFEDDSTIAIYKRLCHAARRRSERRVTSAQKQ